MAQQASVLILAELDDAPRAALEAACAGAGFAPTLEASAEVATTKLGSKRFDALVLHLGTPGAALACMKARGKLLRLRVPVIALVDEEDDAAFARAYRAGADEVLLSDSYAGLAARLRALPKPSIPQPGSPRGDAVVADADRTRAEVLERVLRDAGFRVEVALDGFATRLQAGRPALKVAVVDASLEDAPALITQVRGKGSRCAWVVRARPELLDELRSQLRGFERVAVVSAYGPPDDVLFETNRMLDPKPADGRADARLLHGTILRLRYAKDGTEDVGYSYNVSAVGLFVRTLAQPIGEEVEIHVIPPGGTDRIRLEAKVVWRREFGMTRKEPVPAGFGVRVTGGDMEEWTRSCPQALSIRPKMPDPEPAAEPAAPKRGITLDALRPAARLAPPPKPVVRVAVSAEPPRAREPMSSVEQMLASVLNGGTPPEEAGAAPLSIDGGSVVELATASPPETAEAPAPLADAPTSPPEAAEPEKDDSKASAPAHSAEPEVGVNAVGNAPTERPPPGPNLAPPPPPPTVEAPEPPASEAPMSVSSAEILPESTGLGPEKPLHEPATGSPAGASPVDDARVEDGPTRSDTPVAKSPRPEPASPELEQVTDPSRAARGVSQSPPSRRPPALPRWIKGVLAGLLGGSAGLLVLLAMHTLRPVQRPPASSTVTASPLPTMPVAVASGSAQATEPAASADTPLAVSPPPASAALAAPHVPSATPEPAAPSADVPPIAPAAAAAPAVVGSDGEPDPAELASLPKGQGFLYVSSPLATNVYAYALLLGTTNQRLMSKCGPRFLRLGTAVGAWQGEGVVHVVKCGGFTRIDMAGR